MKNHTPYFLLFISILFLVHKKDSGIKIGAFSAGMGAVSALGGNVLASSVSLNYNKSQNSYHREERMSVGSRLHVKGGVEYNGKNLHTVNLNMLNEGDTVYNITGNIIREAGKSTIKESTGSRGYGLSLAKGSDGMNPFKGSGTTVTAGINGSRGKSEGVYYTNPKDETKGNSHYNVGGDVKIMGVDVKTGSVSGTVGGNMTIESVQDKVDSESRGYSLNYGIGIGNHTVVRNGKPVQTNGVYTSSIGAGYSSGNTAQRTTNAVAGFAADSGIFDVKGKVRQVGSLIDGNFTLNSSGYEYEDLKDIDKSRNIGINMTFTPGVTEIYRNGRMTGEATGGVAVGTRLNYSEMNYVAKVKATVGEATGITVNGKSTDLSGINRDVSNMVEVEKDKKILPMNIDLGTEYWLNDYSREKLKTAMDKASSKYNIEKIRNELTYLNIKRIQKKAERGEKLSEKEKEVYLFVEETKRLYFSYKDNSLKETKNIEELNNKQNENEKLYTVNEKGEKELSYENINNFLYKYVSQNIQYTEGGKEFYPNNNRKEVQSTIASVYILIYEEKIEKNIEYQKFQDEWLTKTISKIYENEKLREDIKKYPEEMSFKNLKTPENAIEIVKEYAKFTTDETLEKYLYKNYNGNKFITKGTKEWIANITEDGKWIFPELKTVESNGRYYKRQDNTIYMNVITGNFGPYLHEINHGIQHFFSMNYSQLANKGYNDKLVDVGRWFTLNDYYVGRPFISDIYRYNIRELDSMSIAVDSGIGKYDIIYESMKAKKGDKK